MQKLYQPISRLHPANKGNIDFEFSYAFQPIVNARKKEIVSFEALVRGPKGEPAASILSRISEKNISPCLMK